MEANTQKKSFINEIGSISDGVVSLGATLAMGVLLFAPALMAVMAMFKRSIDFTMNIYLSMIKHLVFPVACAIVLVIYLIVIIRYQSAGVPIKKIIKKNPIFAIFFVTSVLILASQFYNGAEYAFTGFCAAALGETFGMEICYFVFVLFGATQIKVESHKRFLLRAQVVISMILVLAAFILWHSQVESSFFSDWTPRYSSIFSNTNYYGYYLSIAVAVAGAAFVYEQALIWKTVCGVGFVVNTVALSLNNTMGSWLASIFAILFIVIARFIIEKKVNWQTLVLIPVFALCLYIPGHIEGTFEANFSALVGDMGNMMEGNEAADDAGSGRGRLWKAALDIVDENKLFGIGFEGVKQRQYVGAPYNIRPHNEFIQYAMFHGIPMVIFYFAGCFGIFIRALRKRKEMNGATFVSLCGAFGYLVSSFFGMTIFSTGYLLFVFLGMGYVNGDPIDAGKSEQAKENKNENIRIGFVVFAASFLIIILSGLAGIKSRNTEDIDTGVSDTAVQNDPSDPEGAAGSTPVYVINDIAYYIDDDHALVTSNSFLGVSLEEVIISEAIEIDGTVYPVTVIDDSAFENMGELKSVTIPSSVMVIGAHAFDSCDSLTSIDIPDSVFAICDEAFSGCTGLTSFEFPSSIKEIGTEIFYGCEELKTVKIPEGLTSIPAGTFSGCTALKEVNIPKSVTVIGAEAFDSCEALKELELPEGLLSIEDNAFGYCSGLKEIKIPSTVTSLGSGVFDYCDELKTVYVPESSVKRYKEIFDDEGYDFKVKGY